MTETIFSNGRILSFGHRKRRDQALKENELLRRAIAEREEVYAQCEHDMDKAMQVMDKTVQSLSDVIQVRIEFSHLIPVA